jgi:hypothetical protein
MAEYGKADSLKFFIDIIINNCDKTAELLSESKAHAKVQSGPVTELAPGANPPPSTESEGENHAEREQ